MSSGRVLADRFVVARKVGVGGMGEVYEAFDRKLGASVAVKKLPDLSPQALYLFKKEFRSLQGFGHPNVVKLGELFEVEGEWFFSMELVHGRDLITYIRGASRADQEADTIPQRYLEKSSEPAFEFRPATDEIPTLPEPPIAESFDEDKLRSSIAQLGDAVAALHAAGKVHRDIKPSNVLVRDDGRVVLLDFGLISDETKVSRATTSQIVGTAEYMAPEQAAAAATITAAADCYSLGVILFEALTGRLPFAGSLVYVLHAKNEGPAPDVRGYGVECPEDLAALCMALLRREPGDRPAASAVAAVRAPVEEPPEPAAQSRTISHRPLLVGRDAELDALTLALGEVERGGLVSVVIRGESGIGKSLLVRRFLDDHRMTERTVVLTGRCYEKESVPFKAFDEIVDSLSLYLRRLPKLEVAELVPRYAVYLRTLFPVIGQVAGLDKTTGASWETTDPQELRHRAFSALREIFSALGERRTMIVHIDDFQWADQDSMLLLSELLGEPDPPRMLLLLTSREAVDLSSLGIGGAVRTIALGPLSRANAAQLTQRLFGAEPGVDGTARPFGLAAGRRQGPAVDPSRFELLIDEAHGHPYFITELVRHIQRAAETPGARLGLDEAIWTRAMREAPGAVRILKYVCVAGVPMTTEVLHKVIVEPAADFQAYCNDLTREYLIRTIDSMLAPYHDRVREAVVKRLPLDELEHIHADLAEALAGHPDLALRVRHLEASGQHAKAADLAIAAARRARDGLAFEQAVALYRDRLRLGGTSDAERSELLVELASILVAMGKGLEAAEAFLEAAEHAGPASQLACNIQAAHQLLISGHLEHGLRTIRELFAAQGMTYPSTPTFALLHIVRRRISLSLRDVRRLPRKHRAATARDTAQLALYKAAIQGLVLVDPIRAAFCVTGAALLAREIGDRESYAYFLLLEGDLRKSETTRLRAGAGVIAAFDDHFEHDPKGPPASVVAIHRGARTYMHMRGGDVDALDALIAADAHLTATRIAPWELTGGRTFLLLLLRRLGRYAELRQRYDAYMLDAQRRNDTYSEETMRGFCNLLHLVDDEPKRARTQLAGSIWISYEHGFHVQHWYDFNALMELHIYECEAPKPDHVKQQLTAYASSQVGRLAVFAIETEWLIGRLGLAFPHLAGFGRGRIKTAIRRLERGSAPYPRLLAAQLRAGLAASSGHTSEACTQLRHAIQLGKGLDMRLQPAIATYQLGVLTRGDEGEALCERARTALAAEGVRDSVRLVNLMAPGFSIVGRRSLGPGDRSERSDVRAAATTALQG